MSSSTSGDRHCAKSSIPAALGCSASGISSGCICAGFLGFHTALQNCQTHCISALIMSSSHFLAPPMHATILGHHKASHRAWHPSSLAHPSFRRDSRAAVQVVHGIILSRKILQDLVDPAYAQRVHAGPIIHMPRVRPAPWQHSQGYNLRLGIVIPQKFQHAESPAVRITGSQAAGFNMHRPLKYTCQCLYKCFTVQSPPSSSRGAHWEQLLMEAYDTI